MEYEEFMARIKPCKQCGNKPTLRTNLGRTRFMVRCESCEGKRYLDHMIYGKSDIKVPRTGMCKDIVTAIEKWNEKHSEKE